MFEIYVRGQAISSNNGATCNFDATFYGYAQAASLGSIDGLSGAINVANASIRNNSSIAFPMYIGVNSGNNIAIALGDVDSRLYFGRLTADVKIVLGHNTGRYLTGYSWTIETGTNFGWLDRIRLTGFQQHLHSAEMIATGTLPSGRMAGNYPGITGVGQLPNLVATNGTFTTLTVG